MTFGGAPDPAYRIARCFQHYYKEFVIFVPSYCKSAGTLLALGAHEVVMSELGELGPLDIQYAKRDDFWGQTSGLDLTHGLDSLLQHIRSQFLDMINDLRGYSKDRVQFKTAFEISAAFTSALFQPVLAQINPLYMGEVSRSLQIARSYGSRLIRKSNNLRSDALNRLISDYPAHGFIIDYQEAVTLFRSIRPAEPAEDKLGDLIVEVFASQPGEPPVGFLSDLLDEAEETTPGSTTEGQDDEGTAQDSSGDQRRGEASTEVSPQSTPANAPEKVTRIQNSRRKAK